MCVLVCIDLLERCCGSADGEYEVQDRRAPLSGMLKSDPEALRFSHEMDRYLGPMVDEEPFICDKSARVPCRRHDNGSSL
jgi:hypothetical protein